MLMLFDLRHAKGTFLFRNGFHIQYAELVPFMRDGVVNDT